MYKRSEPNSKDAYDYQRCDKTDRNRNDRQTQPDKVQPQPDGTLEKFINDEKFIKLLKKKGVKSLFKIQVACFKPLYEGYDIIARDRTGSGKTLAFTLPIIQRFRQKKFEHKYPKFLIILPTRQLAIQVHNQLLSLKYQDTDDFTPYVVYGKTSIEDNIRKLDRGVDILVGTPGRLNDLLERGAIRLDTLQVLCLDEADQILKQGFKEEIEKIFAQIKKVNTRKVQTLLFSATIPTWLRDLSNQYQSKNTPYINMIDDNEIRTSKQIKHYAVQISRLESMQVIKLIEEMVDKYGGYEKRILIFCQKKVEVNDLSNNLRIRNQPLHGDIVQRQRQRAYESFKNGSLKCIVATNVAARGLDFPSVDLVIQMCPPLNTEDYIHRAGRTGRAGKQGACLTFYDRTKSRLIYKIQGEAKIKMEQVRINISNLQSGSGYEERKRNSPQNNYNRDRNYNSGRNQRERPNDRDFSARNQGGGYRGRDDNQGDRDYQRNGQNVRDSYQRSNNYSNGQIDGSRYLEPRDNYRSQSYNNKPESNYQGRRSPQKQCKPPQSNDSQSVQRRQKFSRSNSRSSSPKKAATRAPSPKRQDPRRYDQRNQSSNNQQNRSQKTETKPIPSASKQNFDY